MERTGFALDVDYCKTAEGRARDEEAVCLTELDKWQKRLGLGLSEEFNWASPKQLVGLFHERLGLPPSPVWKKGRVRIQDGDRKLDETALSWLAGRCDGTVRVGLDELIRLRRLRGAIKYLAKLPGYVASDGLVHPVCGPAGNEDDRSGTITWRLASKNPEIQQIPVDEAKDWFRIRRAFVPPAAHTLVVADEKALECVILAHILLKLFGDGQLAEMVADGAPDIHSRNAREVFGRYLGWTRHGRPVVEFPLEAFQDPEYPELKQLRQDIKAVWYGLMYGKSPYGFATSLRDSAGEPVGETVAQRVYDGLLDAVPGVRKYQAWVLEYILRYHGMVGLSGAWVDLRELTESGDKWRVARAHRIAQNFPMQEGGARVIGHAMVEIDNDEVLTAAGLKMERQIHDELDFRLPLTADLAMVKKRIEKHMTSYPLLSQLQVKIGTGDTWDSAK